MEKTPTITATMSPTDSSICGGVQPPSSTNKSNCADVDPLSTETCTSKKSGTIIPDDTWNTQVILAALESMPRPNPTFVARSIKHYPPTCAPACTPLSPHSVPRTPSISPMTPQGAFESASRNSPHLKPHTTAQINPPSVGSASAPKVERPKSRKPPPVADIEHVGPVFPKYRAVLVRESRPYIHAVCGAGFRHPDDVKSHHVGRAARKTAGCRGKQNGEDIPW